MRLLITALAFLISVSLFGQSPCNNQTSVTHQGYEYDIVEIGEQCWFAENCRYLPEVSPPFSTVVSVSSSTEPYYYVYYYQGFDVSAAQATTKYATYGVLYNWPAVMTEDICPSGWHIPSDGEFTQLTDFLGGESNAGYVMKSTSGWDSGGNGRFVNGNGSNSSGFTGLPGGRRDFLGGFKKVGDFGNWWSASESGSGSWVLKLNFINGYVNRNSLDRKYGFSARCVRD
tara:strand:+ start:1107 stop:1793 length:687 start_codon:yes stop_codon:yes gene_type:complete